MIVFQRETEDELIECMLRGIIAEEEGSLPLNQNLPSESAANTPVRWPTQGSEPVNEYTIEGYITMAFPLLFPYGKADLRDQSHRQIEIGTTEYFDALLRYKDGKFGSHPWYKILGILLC